MGDGFGMQDAGCRMQDTGCRMQDTGYRMPDRGYLMHYFFPLTTPVSDVEEWGKYDNTQGSRWEVLRQRFQRRDAVNQIQSEAPYGLQGANAV